jgi:DNA-binding MarR family transcriptional regulator/ribosomal protein S18 acetylase RimI-like enzyme
MDLINTLEELALASRMKRLSDRLMEDMAEIYREANADFKPRWFTVFMTLDRQDKLTVTDIARQLGISHTAVNQIVTDMGRHGLIEKIKDSKDERQFRISMTRKGKNTRRDLDELWKGVKRANAELLKEAGADLLGDLRRIEEALDKRDMGNRMRQWVGLPERAAVRILDYRPAYKKHFAALNYQWLEEDFAIEYIDRRMLEDPNGFILKRGGDIMFAVHGEDIVGTCALVAREDGDVELVKMAVTPSFRGRGIGRLLTLHAIDRAKALGARKIVLATSPRLLVANVLYKSIGFKVTDEGPAEEAGFERPSISMELDLNP